MIRHPNAIPESKCVQISQPSRPVRPHRLPEMQPRGPSPSTLPPKKKPSEHRYEVLRICKLRVVLRLPMPGHAAVSDIGRVTRLFPSAATTTTTNNSNSDTTEKKKKYGVYEDERDREEVASSRRVEVVLPASSCRLDSVSPCGGAQRTLRAMPANPAVRNVSRAYASSA